MVTIQNIKQIKEKLKLDESICRLLYYGEKPFSVEADVRGLSDFDYIFDYIVKFSPQTEDLLNSEKSRLVIYKSSNKVENDDIVIRRDVIEIGILVPYRLQQLDLRVYQIEEVVSSLLDNMPMIGLGNLSYCDGFFAKSPIDNYCYYRMVFKMREARGTGRYGRY